MSGHQLLDTEQSLNLMKAALSRVIRWRSESVVAIRQAEASGEAGLIHDARREAKQKQGWAFGAWMLCQSMIEAQCFSPLGDELAKLAELEKWHEL